MSPPVAYYGLLNRLPSDPLLVLSQTTRLRSSAPPAVALTMVSTGLVIVVVVCQRSRGVYGVVQAKDIQHEQE